MRCLGRASCLLLCAVWAGCGGSTATSDPLGKAVFQRDEDEIRRLAAAGVDLNRSINDSGETALHFACRKGFGKPATLLVELGADVQRHDAEGNTPWDVIWKKQTSGSLRQGEIEALTAIVKAGYVPEVEMDDRGRTFLHQLAERHTQNGPEFVALVIEETTLDVTARDNNGWTPLHVAAFDGNYGACQALLEAGADVNAETTTTLQKSTTKGFSESTVYRYEAGSRPLDLVRSRGTRLTKSVVPLLEEHGGKKSGDVNNVMFGG